MGGCFKSRADSLESPRPTVLAYQVPESATMRDEIADLVHPVLYYGLQLRERLDQGEPPDLHTEQAHLKRLLLTEMEAKRSIDYGGEPGAETRMGSIRPVPTAETRRGGEAFLGVRYALVCWLDEVFINSPWEREWNERKLEVALYGTNDRSWAFWEQARRAEARPGTDSLEVFFLCVMLGFRGEMREDPGRLQTWVSTAQTRIAKGQGQEWPQPPELEPQTYVPPRHGRERLQRMVLSVAAFVLVAVLVLTFYVMNRFLGE